MDTELGTVRDSEFGFARSLARRPRDRCASVPRCRRPRAAHILQSQPSIAPALGGVARGQCLSTGIRQRRHHPPVGRLVQLQESFALKQSSRPDLVGIQKYARLVACCLQDAPHGGCKCHWSPSSRFWMKPSMACRALQSFYRNSWVSSISGSNTGWCALTAGDER
jgi:hypothetical protein